MTKEKIQEELEKAFDSWLKPRSPDEVHDFNQIHRVYPDFMIHAADHLFRWLEEKKVGMKETIYKSLVEYFGHLPDQLGSGWNYRALADAICSALVPVVDKRPRARSIGIVRSACRPPRTWLQS